MWNGNPILIWKFRFFLEPICMRMVANQWWMSGGLFKICSIEKHPIRMASFRSFCKKLSCWELNFKWGNSQLHITDTEKPQHKNNWNFCLQIWKEIKQAWTKLNIYIKTFNRSISSWTKYQILIRVISMQSLKPINRNNVYKMIFHWSGLFHIYI